MTLDQAFQNLINICQAYKGDWSEHASLQESLRIVKEGLTPKAPVPPSPKPKERKHA